jgi:hypothetical protein
MIDEKKNLVAVINIKKLESQRIDELEAKIEAKLNQIMTDNNWLMRLTEPLMNY